MYIPDLLKCSFRQLVILQVSHHLQEDAAFLAPLPGLVYLASLPFPLILSFCISGIKKVGIQPSTQLTVAYDAPRVCLFQPFTPLTSSHTAHSFACCVSLLAVTRHNSKEVSVLSLQFVYSVPSLISTRLTPSSLAPFLLQSRTIWPGNSAAHRGPDLPVSISNQDNLPETCPPACFKLILEIFQWVPSHMTPSNS